MRILYFHQYFSTRSGSVGTRSYEMARALVERRHSVLMVCGSGVREESGLSGDFVQGCRRGLVDGIEVAQLDMRYANADAPVTRALTFLRFAWKALRIALTEEYDLVFATSTPLTVALPGIAAAWLRRKPFVFEVRDLWPELPKAMGVIRSRAVLGVLSALEFVAYHSAVRLIALAPGIRDGIVRRGVKSDKVSLVPNGCDLDLFLPREDEGQPRSARSRLVAVFAGAHGRANGLDAVLDAALELQRRGRAEVQFVLVGEGSEKERLVERAATLGLANVSFHPSVEKLRLAELLQQADIGLQVLANVPAFYDGTSPNKFFDYIAAGLPVLINYPGWLAREVSREACGFAVPPEDPIAFADTLEQALRRRHELPEMGRRARQLAERDYSREVLATRFVDCLELARSA